MGTVGLPAGVLLCVCSLAGAQAAAAERPDFRIHDPEVTESSGLVISRGHPSLAYTVNDSGDTARVFVVDMRSGDVVGETQLSGVEAVDVEALGSAPDGRLMVADIGDNYAERESVSVHLLPEPAAGDGSAVPRTITLTYPGGPRDAEAVFARAGQIFVVSKRIIGAKVFAARVFASSRTSFRLRPVARAPGLVTDATVMADGRVVLRDYGRATVFSVPEFEELGSFGLPPTRQGETLAAAVKGPWVYAGSEGADSPVYRVRVPDRFRPPRGDGPDRSTPAPQRLAADESQETEDDRGLPAWAWWVAVGAVVVAGGAVGRRLLR
ncbi:MAG: hypothetical protein GEU93_11805 [Propionibacteriales bacterium]|nr:hypothetical protein [Propionibacteriales bacterium]